MITERDQRWDVKGIVIRDQGVDTLWDGKTKGLVYNSTSMEWEAATPSSGGGGSGSGPLSADTSSIETRSQALKTLVDESTSTVTYVGEAATSTATTSALWRIKRITQAGSVLIIEWADGDGSFNNIWNNRASLTYS